MSNPFARRLAKLESVARREGLTIEITHYLGEETEPLRQELGLPHNLREWPAAALALLTPIRHRAVQL